MHLDHNYSPYTFFNLMMSEEFRSRFQQECTNRRSETEGARSKGDWDRTKYPDFIYFSLEEIYSYLGLLLDNDIKMKPHK